jgi:hypothetical protein
MKKGYFYDKNNNIYVSEQEIEKQLPDIFLTDAMKDHENPKVEYLSLIGITCCAGHMHVDRMLIDRIIDDDLLYDKCIEFLCEKYNFYSYTINDDI